MQTQLPDSGSSKMQLGYLDMTLQETPMEFHLGALAVIGDSARFLESMLARLSGKSLRKR
jgi:hypothetical protein